MEAKATLVKKTPTSLAHISSKHQVASCVQRAMPKAHGDGIEVSTYYYADRRRGMLVYEYIEMIEGSAFHSVT